MQPPNAILDSMVRLSSATTFVSVTCVTYIHNHKTNIKNGNNASGSNNLLRSSCFWNIYNSTCQQHLTAHRFNFNTFDTHEIYAPYPGALHKLTDNSIFIPWCTWTKHTICIEVCTVTYFLLINFNFEGVWCCFLGVQLYIFLF